MPISTFQTKDGRRVQLTHYGSITEMEEDCITRPMKRAENIRQHRENVQTMPDLQRALTWYGVRSLDEVKRVIREGYTEGAALVDQTYDAMQAQLPRALDFRRQLVRADQGDSLDIHAVNRGNLDRAWTTVKRNARMGTGLIRIVVDICGNCTMRADSLKWRGVAALALARVMQKAGYSIEVVAAQAGGGAFAGSTQDLQLITTVIKPRYAAVDTATLASSVVLPGFFRYLGFAAIIRQADDLNRDVSWGLGQSWNVATIIQPPEKVMQVVTPQINSQQEAQAWIKEAVALLQLNTMSAEKGAR